MTRTLKQLKLDVVTKSSFGQLFVNEFRKIRNETQIVVSESGEKTINW